MTYLPIPVIIEKSWFQINYSSTENLTFEILAIIFSKYEYVCFFVVLKFY